jgi:polysaccharide biosynthesis protein PslH
MRILMLSVQYPESLVGGYECTLYHIIEGYHRHGHKVDLMAFVPGDVADVKRGLVDSWCDNIFLFEPTDIPSWRSPRRWRNWFSLNSSCSHCSSRAFTQRLRDILVANRPDLVHFEGYGMLQHRKHIGDVPCVAFPVDCATLAIERDGHKESGLRALWLALHRAKVRWMESRYDRFYGTMFVAQPDADRAKQLSPRANIVRIPNGVDTAYFAPTSDAVEPKTIALHGHMSFPPNAGAALWFMAEVWPELKRCHPTARFLVVGADPGKELLAAAKSHADVVVTGMVPDIRPYLQRASILVAPMHTGTGIKNKVLEGMAMAKPMVITSLARSGINGIVPGQHVMQADTSRQFIDAICELWRNPQQATLMGANARELVRTHYSWESMQDACELLARNAVVAATLPRRSS